MAVVLGLDGNHFAEQHRQHNVRVFIEHGAYCVDVHVHDSLDDYVRICISLWPLVRTLVVVGIVCSR